MCDHVFCEPGSVFISGSRITWCCHYPLDLTFQCKWPGHPCMKPISFNLQPHPRYLSRFSFNHLCSYHWLETGTSEHMDTYTGMCICISWWCLVSLALCGADEFYKSFLWWFPPAAEAKEALNTKKPHKQAGVLIGEKIVTHKLK